MPVDGTHSPASAATAGSRSRTPASSSSVTSTPFARPRRTSSAIRGSSASSVATTTLPHSDQGRSCSAQNAFVSAQPATARRALSDPGA
jgi:hypothetical protein